MPSRHAGSLADHLMQQGDLAADRAARSGQVWGNVVRSVTGIPAGIRERRVADQERANRQRAFDSQLETDKARRTAAQAQTDEIHNQRMDTAAAKDLALTTQKVSAWLGDIAAAPDAESQKMAYTTGRQALLQEGRLTPQDAPEFFPGPSWVKARMAQLLPATERFKAMFPERNLHNVPAGASAIDANNPQKGAVFTAPHKPADPPAVGSFEDYVVRKHGATPTPEQIEHARKVYQQADDQPRLNVTLPSGLSPTMESNILNRLTNQWTKASEPARELERQVRLMDVGLAAARKGDMAQGAQAILVTFQKILDPTSVVRESEYMRSAAGLSLLNRIEGAAERLSKGGAGVPLPELEKFAALAREAADQQRAVVSGARDRIGRAADHYRIPRDLIFEGGPTISPPPSAGTIRARDPQGKLHEAQAGTPLPAGWKAEP